jgi:hypothetical protein
MLYYNTYNTRFNSAVQIIIIIIIIVIIIPTTITYSRIHPDIARKEITQSLWNLKIHYSVCKTLPLVHILRKINPAHSLPLYDLHIHKLLKKEKTKTITTVVMMMMVAQKTRNY